MNEIELKYILGLEVRNFLDIISWAMIITGIITFFTTLYIRAPYGRYSASKGWGILLPARFACASSCKNNLGNQLLSAMYIGHYINRAMIYPLRMNNSPNPMPISVTFLAFSYCCWNGLTQSLSLTIVNPKPEGWIYDIRFILGTIIFLIGMYINISSDAILFNIRLKAKDSKSSYAIPRGGVFEYVSCANYFGEIIEWFGYALASWSIPGLAFAIFTFCNIGPRGANHHLFYLSKFDDYPKSRKAVIPFIW